MKTSIAHAFNLVLISREREPDTLMSDLLDQALDGRIHGAERLSLFCGHPHIITYLHWDDACAVLEYLSGAGDSLGVARVFLFPADTGVGLNRLERFSEDLEESAFREPMVNSGLPVLVHSLIRALTDASGHGGVDFLHDADRWLIAAGHTFETLDLPRYEHGNLLL